MLDLRLTIVLAVAACRAPASPVSAPSAPAARDAAVDTAAATSDVPLVAPDAATVAMPPPPPPPASDKATRIQVRTDRTAGDIDDECKKTLPRCAHVFADIQWPPNPCANRGAACNEPPRSRAEKVWAVCRCEACSTDRDCPSGTYCATHAGQCPPQRVAGTCKAGPRRPEDAGMCPAPP